MTGALGAILAGKAFVELGVDTTPLKRGLAALPGLVQRGARFVAMEGAKSLALGTAIAAPLVGATRSFSQWGDTVAKNARRTGIAATSLAGWRMVAEEAGSSAQAFEVGIRTLARNLYDAGRGSTEAIDAFDAVGLSWESLKDMSPEEQLLTLAEALKAVEDPSLKMAVAQKLLGRGGTELIPLMDLGSEKIQKLVGDMNRLVGMTKEDYLLAEQMTDAQAELALSFQGVKNQVGAVIARALLPYKSRLFETLGAVREWMKANPALIKGMGSVAAAFVGLGTALIAVAIAGRAVSLLMKVGPWVAVAGAVLLIAEALGLVDLGLTDLILSFEVGGRKIGAWVDIAASYIQQSFDTAWAAIKGGADWLWEGISHGAQWLWTFIEQGWAETTRWMQNAITDVVSFAEKAWNWIRRATGSVVEFFGGEGYTAEDYRAELDRLNEKRDSKVSERNARAAERLKQVAARRDTAANELREGQAAAVDRMQKDFGSIAKTWQEARRLIDQQWADAPGSKERFTEMMGKIKDTLASLGVNFPDIEKGLQEFADGLKDKVQASLTAPTVKFEEGAASGFFARFGRLPNSGLREMKPGMTRGESMQERATKAAEKTATILDERLTRPGITGPWAEFGD